MRIVCYVLCPNDETLATATAAFADKDWARPILLPQNQPYLESYMYTHHLMSRYDEWKDADWVGCIAHSAPKKQPAVADVDDICRQATENQSDFIALMYRGDPLVETAEKWHPGFTRAWVATWECIGWPDSNVTLNPNIPSFYCNYWLTTPVLMRDYCSLMAYLDVRIRTHQQLRELLWVDSGYRHRGPRIAKIPKEKCKEMWNVEWYPMHIFVMERMICLYAAVFAKKLCLRT
jgi:hypothetical protein